MFGFLKPFRKILVTGPQRSGTRICAKMIAHDLNLTYIDENDIGWTAPSIQRKDEFVRILRKCTGFVVQAPAMAHACHVVPDHETAVVFMRRDIEDIIASQERIGWDHEEAELAKYGGTFGPIAEVKYDCWTRFQRDQIPHAFEMEYEALARHSLWIPKEKRGDFLAGQTALPPTIRMTYQDFDNEWPTMEERDWIRDESARVAERFGPDCTIVHIGVERGISLYASYAGAPEARLVGVDLDISQLAGDLQPELIQGNSQRCHEDFTGPIHFLFVDGDHTAHGVLADLHGWLPRVVDGGTVALHDYRNWRQRWCAGVKFGVDCYDWRHEYTELYAPESIRAFRKNAGFAGDGFGSVGIGVPLYRSCPEFWLSWTWLLLDGREDCDRVLNRLPWIRMAVRLPIAHNDIIRFFLDTDLDTLCIIEDDHYFPYDQLRKMRYKLENRAFDIVCASYIRRSQMDVPLAMGWNFAREDRYSLEALFDLGEALDSGTVKYEGAAFGFALIRRWVLEAMLGGKDPESYQWAETEGVCSPDVPFYWKASKELGAKVGVDRDNWIGHMGQFNYTRAYYADWWQKHQARMAQEALKHGKV